MNDKTAYLKQTVQLALDGGDASHKVAQDYSDFMDNWIHAVLHKTEGDEWSSQ